MREPDDRAKIQRELNVGDVDIRCKERRRLPKWWSWGVLVAWPAGSRVRFLSCLRVWCVVAENRAIGEGGEGANNSGFAIIPTAVLLIIPPTGFSFSFSDSLTSFSESELCFQVYAVYIWRPFFCRVFCPFVFCINVERVRISRMPGRRYSSREQITNSLT